MFWVDECMDCWFIRNFSEDVFEIYNKLYFMLISVKGCIINYYMFSEYFMMFVWNYFFVKECRNIMDFIL